MSIEYTEDLGDTQAASVDLLAILKAAIRRWKLITIVAVSTLAATYGALKLVPQLYKSSVEILVYDPQRQIDSAVQKPISPFVDAIGYDAMNTEVGVLKSKSVALRVASELHLDGDREFQSRSRLADLMEQLGLSHLGRADSHGSKPPGATDLESAANLDQAADALLGRIEVWPNSYILTVSATSENPAKAQLLAATIAKDYLASQREARQEALQHVASWLKDRVDTLRSRMLEAESAIEKLKVGSGIRDTEFDIDIGQQIAELNTRLMGAREQVSAKRAQLEQARRVIDSNGDIQSIPELTASATLTELRQRQLELSLRADELQKSLGERHIQVVNTRAALAAVNKQIGTEAEHILGNMQNAYDIAVRQEQSQEANLQRLTGKVTPETYTALQQLRRVADADRSLYESYVSQYNDISERRTLQDASARIISPATLPRSPSSSRRRLYYGIGGMLGLGGGLLFAFLLEYLRPGVKTCTEVEEFLGRPVVGVIPSLWHRKRRDSTYDLLLGQMVDESPSYLSEAVHALRISLDLSNASPKAILITSALPAEGKSTAAMLLAASSASAGRRTILLDCDLHQRSTSEALRQRSTSDACGSRHKPGLSELLRSTAKLSEVITRDSVTQTYVIPAGSTVPNAADLLMSQRMRDLIAVLRHEFDYIVMDAPPLLPVVDALALSTVADKILMVVRWSHTPRASISEAFKVLRPEAHRVAGIVLNKVDLNQLPEYGYGTYRYRSATAAGSAGGLRRTESAH